MLQLVKLSPAQRAWETRRAKAEGRAIVEARHIEIAAPVTLSPLGEARMVSLWLDRQDVGCGLRRYIVLDVGAPLVRLFSAAKLLTIEVDRNEFDRYARPVRAKARTISAIIKTNQRM